jgi:hypothetical protein
VNLRRLRLLPTRYTLTGSTGIASADGDMSMTLQVTPRGRSRHIADGNAAVDETQRWRSPVTREFERLMRLWRLAEVRRDLVVMMVVQSRIGRLTYAAIEGAVARG